VRLVRLVTPSYPALSFTAGKSLNHSRYGPLLRASMIGYCSSGIWLPGVLSLPTAQIVDLRSSGRQRSSILPTYSKEEQFSYVVEVEIYAPPVRSAVLANLVPHEIEWNNKDPFLDRDLADFKRLHAEGAMSVGVIITRGSSPHDKMWDFVSRFAKEQHVTSCEDLERLDVQLTRRKRGGDSEACRPREKTN
jgi:hypothetical protein